ncbi:MAG: putative CRISPR-associated protein [Cyanomargarita calcarea GSE-NOS-MK-12-04C]|jgi:putative CRISPR-associated protein (TIGR02619 family)|uniref:CRISPR-associated protein n=1 Tax=Cyanomargarita calcarea GSE-NOS-MK-12-04C TaxID=2839659 RepID=A0A951UU32_9CYAN|nr:putative CRISPR-associated protein [Cyanomargarita calcarea GSE-NOS-MK-12-04C]
MPQLVISTVGTSLLTNQLNERTDKKDWKRRMIETANLTYEEINKYHEDVADIISQLKERANKKIYNTEIEVEEICEISAELNGIYGLYGKKLEEGVSDTHVLIATDTAQGRIAAEVIESYLKSKGLNSTSVWIQPELSLASSNVFTESIAKLIPSMQQTILDCKKTNYRICFNLVGGFKALQGYFNTIGMFYADEIIYVFEGSNELIKIPKLPIKINIEEVEPYKVQLAMMAVGDISKSWEEAKKVPQEWAVVDGQEMTLSTWGQLIWSQCQNELLSQDKPLKFPKIDYTSIFLDEYKNKPANEKIILQENLARAACLLVNHKDGITAMKQDGIFRLRRYEGKNKDIEHFDLPKGRRVSCIAVGNNLQIRHYGEHDYVNDNP